MIVICPKCHLVRPKITAVPEWQCPGCGVVYTKAGDAPAPRAASVSPARRGSGGGLGWGKWMLVGAVLCGLIVGFQVMRPRPDARIDRLAGSLGGNPLPVRLRALAEATKPGDVIMFTSARCPRCGEASQWMNSHGFRHRMCDIDANSGCHQELQRLGGHGVPYLVVKGHHMKDGFDSDEFVLAIASGGE